MALFHLHHGRRREDWAPTRQSRNKGLERNAKKDHLLPPSPRQPPSKRSLAQMESPTRGKLK